MTEGRRDGSNVSGIAATIAEGAASAAPTVPPGAPDSFAATIAPGAPDSFAPTIAPGAPAAIAPGAPDSFAPTIAPVSGYPGVAPETHRDSPKARTSASSIRPPQRPSVKDNRYALGTEIARGGMGRVVEATDHLLGRTVAIKEALIADEDLRLRFMRETRITARLEHPSIVPVYDAGTMPDGSPFYVMRRVSGRPLEELVYRAETLDQRLALLPNLLAAANAIAHAHSRGIVHRDIKPSNILVGEHGETVVIDWGLAKVVDEPDDLVPRHRDSVRDADVQDLVHTRIGSVVGTPGFMPPEQLKGELVDARSDVYALGATLYFLLARRPPHAAKTGQEMMNAALAGPPTPVRDLVAGVAPELLTIVDKALAYTHDVRYQDAGGLAADLDRFLKGQLVASHRYSRRERLVRFWRRHRIALSIAAVATIAIVVGSWLAIARIVEARRRADAALAQTIERNETLQLARARDLLRRSPIAALELVKPLAGTHWQEARAIAMAARATGVAHRLPGSPFTLSLAMSQDGDRVLASGDDGVIRLHDLSSRSTREIARLGGRTFATFADGERTVVAWGGGSLVAIDVSSGARRDLGAAAPVQLGADGADLWWHDRSGAVWQVPVAGGTPRKLDVTDRITSLATRGGTIALGGEQSLWIVRGGAPAKIAAGRVQSLAVSDTGALAALVDVPAPASPSGIQRTLVEVGPEPGAQARTEPVDSKSQSIAWAGSTLHVGGNATVTPRGGTPVRWQGDIKRLVPIRAGALVAANSSGGLAVLDEDVIVELPPTAAVGELASSPASRYLVAGADESLLVWELEHVMPVKQPLGPGFAAHNHRHDQMVIAHEDRTATWIDLRNGSRSRHPIPGELAVAGFEPSGTRLVLCETAGRGVLYTRGSTDVVELDGPCREPQFVGPNKIVVGAADGAIRLFDIATRTSVPLTTGTAGPWQIQVQGDWVAIVFDDNSLWRMNLATGASSQVPTGRDRWLHLLASGDAIVSNQGVLQIWRAQDGSFVDGPALPGPIGGLTRTGTETILVNTRANSVHSYDTTTGRTRPVFPAGSRLGDLYVQGDTGVFIDGLENIHLASLEVGFTWPLARGASQPLRAPFLSSDGRHAYAVSGSSLLTWTVPSVPTREATLALIDELTR